MSQEELNERMARVEVKLDEHDRKLQAQSEKNEVQIEMNTLLKMQMDVNKEQNKQMREITNTLNNVNDNLTHLNNNQQKLGERVSDIENTLHEQKKSKSEVIKGSLKYIATAIGGIIVAYIYLALGL